MNPAVAHVMQFFGYEHLPARIAAGPQNQETTVALRKLLEAKDAAVRAVISFDPQSAARAPGRDPGGGV